jgi:hypothetical protein
MYVLLDMKKSFRLVSAPENEDGPRFASGPFCVCLKSEQYIMFCPIFPERSRFFICPARLYTVYYHP